MRLIFDKKHKSLILFLLLIFIDQLTKHIIKTNMFFDNIGFYKTTNTGAGFSILSGQNVFLTLITLFFSIWIFYLLYKNKYPSYDFALVFILSGAIGNLIDRILFNHVIDFIKIYSWPIFNLADIFLNIGVLWILYLEFTNRKKLKKHKH